MSGFGDDIEAWGEKGVAMVERTYQGALDLTGARLIERSPIDTGRFKSNWNYGLEAPDTRTTAETKVRTLNNLQERPKSLGGFNHYLTNALPYGPALERGHSKQAPQGIVGLTREEWPSLVQLAVQRARQGA